MGAVATRETTSWLDVSEYPFEPKRLSVEGGRIHFVDEGTGSPIVFVHGTQTWSFLFRHLIRGLSRDHRCVAPDHLGFGLSDKPEAFAGTPAQHARNLARLLDHLGLRDITLVAHDFGGPIAMAYAQTHPDKVRKIVLMNTWMWGLRGDPHAEKIARYVTGIVGKFKYSHGNLAHQFVKPLFYDKSQFTHAIDEAYFGPFQDREHRQGPMRLMQAMIKEHEWYEDLWANRYLTEDAPMMLLWGVSDPHFGERYMNRMWAGFPLANVHRLDHCGHFPPEEKPDECIAAIRQFAL